MKILEPNYFQLINNPQNPFFPYPHKQTNTIPPKAHITTGLSSPFLKTNACLFPVPLGYGNNSVSTNTV